MCLSKSKNKHNRIYASAEPLGDDLTSSIEKEEVRFDMDPKKRSKVLVEKFDWDLNDSKKIWSFGPQHDGPNFLVDQTFSTSYLNEIKDSICTSF